MTKEERDELRRLRESATPGPWHHGKWIDDPDLDFQIFCDTLEVTVSSSVTLEEDAAYIAAAINAMPALLDDLDRLESNLQDSYQKRNDLDGALRSIAARALPHEDVYGDGNEKQPPTMGWIVNQLVCCIEAMEKQR